MSIRWGLCCSFREQPIAFRNTTVAAISRLRRKEALQKLSTLCRANAEALFAALTYCGDNGIGCFRVVSQVLPLKTHPEHCYDVGDLPAGAEIIRRFQECGELAQQFSLRTCFHPDQFVVLNSPRPEVVEASLRELEYQAEVAEWIGADVINIHAGGAFGDKPAALARFAGSLARLSDRVRSRLTLENDDKLFAPTDLLPLCREKGIPLVYDVHHHRCHPDGISEAEATELAIETWNREPLFHISSPAGGWKGPRPATHDDFIDPDDFPHDWLRRKITVEIEAKAKEVAVLRLQSDIERKPRAMAWRPVKPSC